MGLDMLAAHLHLSQCVGMEVAVAGLLLSGPVLPVAMALPYPIVSRSVTETSGLHPQVQRNFSCDGLPGGQD